MTPPRVVLDACVLLPQTLSDLLLTLAEAEIYYPLWTEDLLGEVERNLAGSRFGLDARRAGCRIDAMRRAFPFAEAECHGYRSFISAMTNDPKDRHVVAAAVAARADLIVTANLRDFPADSLEPFGIEVAHPDDFLCALLSLDHSLVQESVDRLVRRNQLPPRTPTELFDSLERLVPTFASDARSGRAPYELWRDADPAERARLSGHAELVGVVRRFISAVLDEGDLRAVWSLVDPDLRVTLAYNWIDANRAAFEADGWDQDAVTHDLAEPSREHPLWPHFSRVHVRSIRNALPDDWGIGTATRPVPPDRELVYIHDMTTLPDGIWQPDESNWVYPVLLRHANGGWMIRNLGTDVEPALQRDRPDRLDDQGDRP